MKFSSSFKVGLLTVIAIIILVFTVMWIKGRAISSGERITVTFQDVNGIRPGSAVQMMGYRIGQIEEITPVIETDKNYVDVKFVIIEPGVHIPTASEISIQQSGLIGEQFLEIIPPKTRFIYIPVVTNRKALKMNDNVEMILSGDLTKVGIVKGVEIVPTETLSILDRENIKSEYVYKVGYIINMPGLILPDNMKSRIKVDGGKTALRLYSNSNVPLLKPETTSKFTVIEPMRLAEFMDIQQRSAQALTETNYRVSAILSDDVILELKQTITNMKTLTQKANTTVEKAEVLLDTSQRELETTMTNLNYLTRKIIVMVDSLNEIAGDKDFQKSVVRTTEQVEKLSKHINTLFDDPKTRATLDNIHSIAANVNDISAFVNSMSKDEKFKNKFVAIVDNFNNTLIQLETTLRTVNSITADDKEKIEKAIDDAYETSCNLKKFSSKLNKHFLLFRLMF